MKNLLMFFKGTPKPLVSPASGTAVSDADQAPSVALKKKTPAHDPNPYIEARREWNERYGDYISQAKNWRFFAFFSGVISLASVIGVSYIGAQNRVVPYVVEVDKFGSAVAVKQGDKAKAVDQRVVKAFLARFIVDWRTVSVDRVAQKDAVVRLYSMLPIGSSGQKKMNDYFQDNNPFVRLQSGTISIEPTSALPISEKTWQVEWVETNRDLRGEILSRLRFKASLVVGITAPTEESQIIVNPLGVFVTDFNVAQQL